MKRFVIALAAFLAFACQGHKPNEFASKPDVTAPKNIQDSFSPVFLEKMDSIIPINNALIRIERSSLEKEFLLQVGAIPQPQIPLGHSLRSRIVSFRQWNDRVYLLEATQGHAITHELPQNLVLASFPIVSQTDSELTFDFNLGMTEIFAASDWKASDDEGGSYNPEYKSVKTKNSFLKKVEFVDNKLYIEQVASTEEMKDNSVVTVPTEIRYYLSPYAPSEGFQPTVSKGFERMGFFEVAPLYDDKGDIVIRASKFDIRKPILYAISSNTPPEFRQAIKDGVLYYNKILGEGKVQIIDAPEGLTAPDLRYNIIQWVTWDKGFGAYADAQMDPRTGETLHAQVYLASVFAAQGKKAARRILARLQTGGLETPRPGLTLRGFGDLAPCQMLNAGELQASLSQLLTTDPADEAVLRAAQDYVREVVTHEVGHTLGLRHNFAGSLVNADVSASKKAFNDYLTKKEEPVMSVSSSVMDYLTFDDSVITGHQIATQPKALDYDDRAMKTLYLGAQFPNSDIPLFCTDTLAGGAYADCLRFDQGANLVASQDFAAKQSGLSMADSVFENFLTQKELIDQGKMNEFTFSAAAYAQSLLSPREEILNSLLTSTRFLKVDRSFPSSGDVFERERQDGYKALVREQFFRAGGLSTVLASVGPADIQRERDRFFGLLERRGASEGLSSAELASLRILADKVFQQFPDVVLEADLKLVNSVSESKPYRDLELSDDLATILGAKAEAVIFATAPGATIQAEIELPIESGTKKIQVTLPKFSVKQELRLEAARLLRGSRGESPIWALYERGRLFERLKKQMDDSLTVPSEKLPAGKLPAPVARWLLENRKVLAALVE